MITRNHRNKSLPICPLLAGSLLCEVMGEGHCTQHYMQRGYFQVWRLTVLGGGATLPLSQVSSSNKPYN